MLFSQQKWSFCASEKTEIACYRKNFPKPRKHTYVIVNSLSKARKASHQTEKYQVEFMRDTSLAACFSFQNCRWFPHCFLWIDDISSCWWFQKRPRKLSTKWYELSEKTKIIRQKWCFCWIRSTSCYTLLSGVMFEENKHKWAIESARKLSNWFLAQTSHTSSD